MPLPPKQPKSTLGLASIAARAVPAASTEGEQAPTAQVGKSRYFCGDVIAQKYRLTRVIGEGGMGAVWLATNLTLEVDVAVKLIRREMSTPEACERLLQEARAAARIGHPSIVRVFDFGQTEHADPFIVMEILRGESLAGLLDRKGRLPATTAVQILLPVAGALAAAHTKGIVHRDLKPDNVVLVEDESGATVPKVVDFGIAKLRKEDVDRKTTTRGTVLGSPDYMSPEQARGRRDVDERSDIWSLSVVLYEAICGRRPFDGDNYNSLLTSIIEDVPPATTDFGAGDDQLWALVSRGLAKRPDDRWPSMRAFGTELARWALQHECTIDVTGASIEAHWMSDGTRRPLAEGVPSSDSARLLLRRSGSGPDFASARGSAPELPEGVETSRASANPSPPVVPVDLSGTDLGPSLGLGRPVSGASAIWSPPKKKRKKSSGALAAVAAIVVLGGTSMLFQSPLRRAADSVQWPDIRRSDSAETGSTQAAVTPAPKEEPAPAAAAPAPEPSATAAPATTTAAAPEPAASSEAPSGSTISQCALPFFAKDTFDGADVDLSFICSETDPRRGASRIKSEVVRASTGRKVAEGMKEWSILGWYEMAAFAVVRRACCASPAALELPPPVGGCKPLDRALDALADAAATGANAEGPLATYTHAIHCAVSGGHASTYGQQARPRAGEEASFRKTLARASAPAAASAAPSSRAAASVPSPPTATAKPAPTSPRRAGARPASPKPTAVAADPY